MGHLVPRHIGQGIGAPCPLWPAVLDIAGHSVLKHKRTARLGPPTTTPDRERCSSCATFGASMAATSGNLSRDSGHNATRRVFPNLSGCSWFKKPTTTLTEYGSPPRSKPTEICTVRIQYYLSTSDHRISTMILIRSHHPAALQETHSYLVLAPRAAMTDCTRRGILSTSFLK